MEPIAEGARQRLEVDELVVRLFVLAGVVVWALAAAGSFLTGRADAALGYGVLALFSVGVFAAGLYQERLAAMLSTIGAGAFVTWGVLAAWETGIWIIVTLSIIAPMVVAAGLYWMAEHEEEVIERAEHLQPIHMVHV